MKFAHHIGIRVFCKEGDNEQEIINAIHDLVDYDFEKEKIELKMQNAELFENKTMKILTVFLERQSHTTKFLKDLVSHFNTEQKELLKKQLSSRLDEKLHFFIRLDKPKLLEGEYWIIDEGDCFHIDITVAAYPHTRDTAKKIIEEMLNYESTQ
jgi:RNA binding exosome subunit